MIAVVPADGLADFDAYERAVLSLLPSHRGTLERRVRHTADDGEITELHLVSFEDAAALAAYRADPARQAAAPMLVRSRARVEVLPVSELPTDA